MFDDFLCLTPINTDADSFKILTKLNSQIHTAAIYAFTPY